MTKDEVLKLALDALEKTNRFVWYGTHSEPIGQIAEQGNTAITAIKEALAQPEPNFAELEKIMLEVWQPVQLEPTKWEPSEEWLDIAVDAAMAQPEQWVGLTDDEVHALSPFYIEPSTYDLIRAAEAKLKEKNT
jgi:hypothetical protein